MKKSRFSESQVVAILKEGEAGGGGGAAESGARESSGACSTRSFRRLPLASFADRPLSETATGLGPLADIPSGGDILRRVALVGEEPALRRPQRVLQIRCGFPHAKRRTLL
jgi:hypothetical protein